MKQKLPKPVDCTNCKFLCSSHFSESLRTEICKSFWKLDDYRRQKDFILMNVKSNSPKRRRPAKEPADTKKIRTNSKSFFLQNKRVCQSFFLKTLGISNGPLLKAFQHKNEFTNFFDGDDKRGRHEPSNKLSADVVSSVITHFEQYATKSGKSRKQVISNPEIRSLRQLYALYREAYAHSLSYTSFKRIFNDNNFSLPADRIRAKPKQEVIVKEETEVGDTQEVFTIDATSLEVPHQNIVVAQVPNSSKFFGNSSQIYEIQLIEIPVMSSSMIEPS